MANRTIVEARLSETSISALRRALGFAIYQVLSLTLSVEGRFVSAGNFSLHLDIQDYLILETEWLETPIEEIDYSVVSVTMANTPKDIKLERLQNGGYVIGYPNSAFIFQRPASPIVRIDIHESEFSAPESKELVIYDHAIIFYRENGNRFSFNADGSIVNQLYCTEDHKQIDSIVENHKCRLQIS